MLLFAHNIFGDIMKDKSKKSLKLVLILCSVIVLCCLIMIGSSYLYLEISLNSAQTDTEENNIPYSKPLPDSSGILLVLPDNSGYLIYLNFTDENITISKIDEIKPEEQTYFGYTVDYKIEADYITLANLIDRLGGIELYDNGETLRYTGFQVLDKISRTTESEDLKREVIRRFFDTVANLGIAKEDFVYIIENTETDLTVPDCYYWPPYITDIAKNLQFIN